MIATEIKPFYSNDFEPYLKVLTDAENQSALIGGMAVSAWGEIH
jgi:hypothetical protein